MRNFILVVIYNLHFEESKTILSLVNARDLLSNSDIFIWDNSPMKQDISTLIEVFNEYNINVTYEHHPENLPLSKVYNYIISCIKNKDYNFLILFDQDTSFKRDFFITLEKSYKENPQINLFLPIVKYKNVIISPNIRYFLKGFYFRKKPAGKYKAKNISAINSGMVISLKYLREKFKGYDERLKFYGVDTYFMMEYCKNETELFILDCEIEHDLTLSTLNKPNEKLIKAYHQMIESWQVLYDGSILKYFVKLYSIFHSIYTSIRFRDTKFLVWKK